MRSKKVYKNEIQLTDMHIFAYDPMQFILKTLISRAGDESFAGVKAGDPPKIVKTDTWEITFHPTIAQVCKHVLLDEVKEIILLNEIKEIGEKFDELLYHPHINRGETAIKWFESFLLEEATKEENEKLTKELRLAKAEIRRLRGMGDEEDANKDEEEVK